MGDKIFFILMYFQIQVFDMAMAFFLSFHTLKINNNNNNRNNKVHLMLLVWCEGHESDRSC